MSIIIHTKSLILLHTSEVRAEQILKYYLRNREFLAPFEPLYSDDFFTLEFQKNSLQSETLRSTKNVSHRFFIAKKENPEEVIGSICLGSIVWGCFKSCFLGYKLDKDHINRGYMTEAILACVEFAFEGLKLHRIEANVMPRNLPSLRVLQKSGFEYEGLSKRYLQINGVWEDHVHMVILNDKV